MTSWASSLSRSTSAVMTRRIWSSTSPPMASSVCLSASSSSWKCRCMASSALPEPAGDVVLGPRVARVREELPRHPELHQLPQQHEASVIGHARRLLHVVGDDDDGVAVLQLEHQVLDLRGSDGIEGRAGLRSE